MDSQEDKLNPEIESEHKDSGIENPEEVAKQAKTGITKMTETAGLPPDLQRQAEAASKSAIIEIDEITAMPTTENRLESPEKTVGDIGQLLDNISVMLTEKINKLSDDETNEWRTRKQSWDLFTRDVSKSDQPEQQRVVLLRNAFRTKFPELSDIAKSRMNIQEEDFRPDIGQEIKPEADFSQAKSLEELYDLIDKYGPIKGGLGTYDPEILKSIIQDVTTGKLEIDYVAETGGLREKVSELSKTNEKYLNKRRQDLTKAPETKTETEDKKAPDFSQAKSLEEVNQLIDDFGPIKVENNRYTPDILKSIIKDVSAGKIGAESLINVGGLRSRVEKFITKTAKKKETINVLTEQGLQQLPDKDFNNIYQRMVGGDNAELLEKEKTPEEIIYFQALLRESARRRGKTVKSSNIKETKQPKVEEEKESIKPTLENLKGLINRLNNAFTEVNRQEKKDALAEAHALLGNEDFIQATSKRELHSAIQAAVAAAEAKIYELEGNTPPEPYKYRPKEEVSEVEEKDNKESVNDLEEEKTEERETLRVGFDEIKNIISDKIKSESKGKANLEYLVISQTAGGLKLEGKIDVGFLGGRVNLLGKILNKEDGIYLSDIKVEARKYVKSLIEENLSKVIPAIEQYFSEQKGKPIHSINIEGSEIIIKFDDNQIELGGASEKEIQSEVEDDSVKIESKKSKAGWLKRLFEKKKKKVKEPVIDENIQESEIVSTEVNKDENKFIVNGINYDLNFSPDGSFMVNGTSKVEFNKYEQELPENWQQLIKEHYSDNPEIKSEFDQYAYTIFIFKNLLSTDKLNENQKSGLRKSIEDTIKQWHNKYPDIFGEKAEIIEEKIASVPFMITRDTRQQLYDLGHSKEVVDNMKPEEAQKILNNKSQENKSETEEFVIPEFLKNKPEIVKQERDVEEEQAPLIEEELGVSEVKPHNPSSSDIKERVEKPKLKGNGKVITGELKPEDKGFGETKPYNPLELKPEENIQQTNPSELTQTKEFKPSGPLNNKEEINTIEESFVVPEFLRNKPSDEEKELIEEKLKKIPNKIDKFTTEANGVNCDLIFYDNGTVELLRKGLSFHAKYEEDPVSEVLNKKWQKIAGKKLSLSELNNIENTANDIYFKYKILQKMEDIRLAEMRSKLAVDITNNMLKLLKYGNIVKDDFFSDRESFIKKVKKFPGQIRESF